MTIDAIETRYKNYRFRSRTEARWAVFFDTIGVAWEYEVQGFHLKDDESSVYYLPDFWLPEHEVWVEIKGQRPTDEEDRKARLLARASARPVLLLAGNPQNPKYRPADEQHLLYDPEPVTLSLPEYFNLDPRSALILAAYGEAMGARFEHGERPRARIINR